MNHIESNIDFECLKWFNVCLELAINERTGEAPEQHVNALELGCTLPVDYERAHEIFNLCYVGNEKA